MGTEKLNTQQLLLTGMSHDHLDWPRLSYREPFKEGDEELEITMGRQHQRVDWPWMEYHTTESWELLGVEEAGRKIYSSAPTVSQTTG